MKRSTATFQVTDIPSFKNQMLNWCARFNIFLFLDSHGYNDPYSRFEWILAAGAVTQLNPSSNHLAELEAFTGSNSDWLFGHLAYDLKNQVEPLQSTHPDRLGFPELFFFQPEVVIRYNKGEALEIASLGAPPETVMQEIMDSAEPALKPSTIPAITQRIPKEEYIDIIHRLKQHIQRGDCYEINFCQEFFAENATIDPLQLYRQLAAVSPVPFGGFYRLDDKYLLCASPERFLQKQNRKLVSQPMKGTIRRDLTNPEADAQLKSALMQSEKDRSENVMVVDLVRNDLSRVCSEATVEVQELFGIYTFPQVHQMVSTVSGELSPGKGFADIIRATFPMGSMTGAPKIRVMELTDAYERSRRGIYSGSIGYIDPNNDFDFNVVIRSIMFNETRGYMSYQVGGGITFYSDPEQEYEESLLKAAAIKKVL